MAEDKEERRSTAQRLAIATPTLPLRPSPDPYQPYSPYATIPLRRPHPRLRPSPATPPSSPDDLHSFLTSPYRRISRVEQMIFQQRTTSPQEGESLANSHGLKPQFKIKTRRYDWQSRPRRPAEPTFPSPTLLSTTFPSPTLLSPTLHMATLSFDWQPDHLGERTGLATSGFQETLKNRMRLTRKSPKRGKETSLLQMLNRISEGTPLHRYKSRAFEEGQRVSAFPT